MFHKQARPLLAHNLGCHTTAHTAHACPGRGRLRHAKSTLAESTLAQYSLHSQSLHSRSTGYTRSGPGRQASSGIIVSYRSRGGRQTLRRARAAAGTTLCTGPISTTVAGARRRLSLSRLLSGRTLYSAPSTSRGRKGSGKGRGGGGVTRYRTPGEPGRSCNALHETKLISQLFMANRGLSLVLPSQVKQDIVYDLRSRRPLFDIGRQSGWITLS